jgi:hypothetical protein
MFIINEIWPEFKFAVFDLRIGEGRKTFLFLGYTTILNPYMIHRFMQEQNFRFELKK